MNASVLLIDDDPVDIQPLQMLLESWGLEALTARSGDAGLKILAERAIDLLISDVCMPGMTGPEVVTAARAACPGLPVVLITGRGDVRSAVNAIKLGAFDYVLKPPDEEELRLTVERALEHSRLRRENEFLRAELAAGGMYGERLIGRSPQMLAVVDMINRVARTDSTVLITGETGTGKEIVAQTIHYRSPRSNQPLVAFNCAALSPTLLESELFGHEKGAFTGAVAARRGRFEEADGGTLFLDEIGETGLDFQVRLLRVLQEGEIERVGGSTRIAVDVRILASTNRDLAEEVDAGRFREDLFYRLRVIPIHVPPLRERKEDIVALANHFVAQYGERYQCPVAGISDAGREYLLAQPWRGNVRELQHTVERAVVLARDELLEPADFAQAPSSGEDVEPDQTLQAFVDRKSREHLLSVLERTDWRKQRAADILGIDRVTLYRMLKKYSLDR